MVLSKIDRLITATYILLLCLGFAYLAEVEEESLLLTECSAVNQTTGFCVPVRECHLDLLILVNWRCGPRNEIRSNPKVCCPKEFINSTTSTIEQDVLEESTSSNIYFSTSTTPSPPVSLVNSPSCGIQNETFPTRILGGETSSPGEFPWLARLMRRSDQGTLIFSCTGVLVTQKAVLTTAHCVVSPALMDVGSLYSITLGEHETDCESSCSHGKESIMISKAVTHPDYIIRARNHPNDVALVFLREPVKFSPNIAPICLLEENEKVGEYFVAGWGKTESDSVSPVKLKTSLPSFSWELCRDRYHTLKIEITNGQVCSGGGKNKDSCQGDSGGPLMVKKMTRWYAAGLVSFGVGCGREGWPGVYTYVPYYIDWIKSIIALNVENMTNYQL